MNILSNLNTQAYTEAGTVFENREAVKPIEDFDRLIHAIRERPLKPIAGFWFNIVAYRGERFIQGDLRNGSSPEGDFRQIAALVDGVRGVDIEGFWPEVQGYPVSKSEADRIASYLARQGKNDVELIVPERNTSRPMAWGRFDDSPEFETYKQFIYPAVIEAIEMIEAHPDMLKVFL